jgi:transposase InsO family protein
MIIVPEEPVAKREKMTIDERYKLIRNVKARYLQASRIEKGQILDTLVEATGLGRKYLIALLKGAGPDRKKRERQRERKYGAKVDDAIRIIGSTLDWICAERLTPVLVETAQHLARHGEMALDDDLLELLDTISISTVRRTVNRVRQDEYRLPQRRGKRRYRNRVADQVPMRVIPWDIELPGHFEVDLVHHAGPEVRGECAYTVQFIDVKTGWSERMAVLGRSYSRMQEAFSRFQAQCPMPVREIHSDNGPEFMNDHLQRFFATTFRGAKFSRSRPWQKNDNRFVEQKNYTLVRAYVGRESFTTQAQTDVLNELYDQMRLYYNFFQPVLRQIARSVHYNADHAPVLVRKQDTARTPLMRLTESDVLDPKMRVWLRWTYFQTNPRTLRREIRQLLDALFDTKTR